MEEDEKVMYGAMIAVQNVALRVLREVRPYIRIGRTERQIADHCRELLAAQGVGESWYHDQPALVRVGERTLRTFTQGEYMPEEVTVAATDLVTVALTPRLNRVGGSAARSFAVVDGEVTPYRQLPEWAETIKIHQYLHDQLELIAKPEMTVAALHEEMLRRVTTLGYALLNPGASFGHSIAYDPAERQFLAARNAAALGDLGFFSWGVHLRKGEQPYGFAMENVYCFYNGALRAVGEEELLRLK